MRSERKRISLRRSNGARRSLPPRVNSACWVEGTSIGFDSSPGRQRKVGGPIGFPVPERRACLRLAPAAGKNSSAGGCDGALRPVLRVGAFLRSRTFCVCLEIRQGRFRKQISPPRTYFAGFNAGGGGGARETQGKSVCKANRYRLEKRQMVVTSAGDPKNGGWFTECCAFRFGQGA